MRTANATGGVAADIWRAEVPLITHLPSMAGRLSPPTFLLWQVEADEDKRVADAEDIAEEVV